MPLIVPCTQRRARADGGDGARRRDAEVVVAVEVHGHVRRAHGSSRRRDPRPPRARRSRACRRRRPRSRPPRPRSSRRARRTRGSARVESTPKNAAWMPCSAAKRIALVMRSSIFSRETPIASSFRSEIGDSITEKRDAELDERLEVGGHRAREAPDLGVQAGLRDQLDRAPVVVGDAREAGLDPVDPELVEQPRDLELLLRVEHDADGLLAVAQRRVVEADAARRSRSASFSDPVQINSFDKHTTPSGNGDSFSAPVAGDQEVVLDAQPAAAGPVAARLDREHHALGDLAAARLVRVRRLVRPRADAVADRVRRLAGIAELARFRRAPAGRAPRSSRPAGSARSRVRRRRAAPPRARGSRRAARRGRAASCGRHQ